MATADMGLALGDLRDGFVYDMVLFWLTTLFSRAAEITSEADLLPEGAQPGTMPTDLEQATGLERLEILGKMQGVDIFDMSPLDASRKGTYNLARRVLTGVCPGREHALLEADTPMHLPGRDAVLTRHALGSAALTARRHARQPHHRQVLR